MNRTVLATLVLLLVIISCDPFDGGSEFDDIKIVTGVQFVDDNGNLIGAAGNPNEKTVNGFIFPNPPGDQLFINAFESIAQIWLIKAEKNDGFQDFNFRDTNVDYGDNELSECALTSETAERDQIRIDISTLSNGYYRVFFRTSSGTLNFSNIYVDSSKTGNEIILFLNGEW